MISSFEEDVPYRSAAERKSLTEQAIARIAAENPDFLPIRVIHKRKLAQSFWGQAWNRNLDTYQDYDARFDRGRRHLRAGAVVNLQIVGPHVEAHVWDQRLYAVSAIFAPLAPEKWALFREESAGELDSLVALLQGKMSEGFLARIVDPVKGLFPERKALTYRCTCLDDAELCEHIAAVLYGIGVCFDENAELFFPLRGVSIHDWMQTSGECLLQEVNPPEREELGILFDIDLL
jgi:uncharacterized Zn finger protein